MAFLGMLQQLHECMAIGAEGQFYVLGNMIHVILWCMIGYHVDATRQTKEELEFMTLGSTSAYATA
jgi:hypothetical protein